MTAFSPGCPVSVMSVTSNWCRMHTDDAIHCVLIAAMLAEAAGQTNRAAALIQAATFGYCSIFSGQPGDFGASPSRADPARAAAT